MARKEDNEKKKEVENNVASSLLNRTENNQIRKGFKYTFTIYIYDSNIWFDAAWRQNKFQPQLWYIISKVKRT